MQDFRQLRVWFDAMDLTVSTVTRRHNRDERFGSVSQSRCSAVSVASDIAQGAGTRRVEELEDQSAIAAIEDIGRLGRRLLRLQDRLIESGQGRPTSTDNR